VAHDVRMTNQATPTEPREGDPAPDDGAEVVDPSPEPEGVEPNDGPTEPDDHEHGEGAE